MRPGHQLFPAIWVDLQKTGSHAWLKTRVFRHVFEGVFKENGLGTMNSCTHCGGALGADAYFSEGRESYAGRWSNQGCITNTNDLLTPPRIYMEKGSLIPAHAAPPQLGDKKAFWRSMKTYFTEVTERMGLKPLI